MKHAVLLLVLGCAKAPPTAAEPARTHAILRPTFIVEGKQLRAGTAFVLMLADRPPLLVTAFHVFGRAGGYDRDLTWDQVPHLVTKAEATSVEDDRITVIAGAPLAIEGAVGMSAARVGGDVAALPVTGGSRAGSLTIATEPPAVGARVTLLAQVLGTDGFRHGATVLKVTDEAIAYRYDQPIEIRATSGAAVVDEHGRVVAINLGAVDRDGAVIGIGNPVRSFEPALRRALGGER
jgi:hypothetical protein